MKFVVTKSTDYNYKEEIELNTLEDLIAFVDKVEESVIIHRYGVKTSLEIYDGWRE